MGVVLNEIQLTKKQLRQMQLIQLEILIELDRICRKNGINYSLDGGTLLGAVRHKGFIPWDDDIDVIMTRNEYGRFFEVCQNEMDEQRFFLQEERTDPFYRNGYSRIRRKGSVYKRAGHEHMKYKTGVFIDVFILDNVPDGILSRKLHQFLCYCIRRILWSESGRILHPRFLGRKWFGILSLIPRDFVFLLLNKLAVFSNRTNTNLVRHMTYPYPSRCKYGVCRKYFNEFTEISFEGYDFFAVREYHDYLSDLYGDYMTLPPVEKRHGHIHISEFIPVKPQLEKVSIVENLF